MHGLVARCRLHWSLPVPAASRAVPACPAVTDHAGTQSVTRGQAYRQVSARTYVEGAPGPLLPIVGLGGPAGWARGLTGKALTVTSERGMFTRPYSWVPSLARPAQPALLPHFANTSRIGTLHCSVPLSRTVLRQRKHLATLAPEDRRCLVVGGCGGLGSAVVELFSRTPGWQCTSVDFRESAAAHANVVIQGEELSESAPRVLDALPSYGFDVIMHAAGSWAGSDPGAADFPASLQMLWRANVESAALAAHLAGQLLRPNGMLILSGAKVACDAGGTPGMTAYGMTKAATHHLTSSMAASLTDGRRAFAILPVTIDTAANRCAMPDADTSAWTDPEDVAREVMEWAQAASSGTVAEGRRLPENGSSVLVLTESNQTRFVYPTGAPVADVGMPGGRSWRRSVKASKGFLPPTFHHVNVVSREVGEMHAFYKCAEVAASTCSSKLCSGLI